MKITVMSFNVQHCKSLVTHQIDYDVMVEAIRTCGAGTMEGYEPPAEILANKVGYHYYFAKVIDAGEVANPYDNALLSRFPIRSAVSD